MHLATLVTVTSLLNVSTSMMQDVIGAVFFLLSLVKQAQPWKVSLVLIKMKWNNLWWKTLQNRLMRGKHIFFAHLTKTKQGLKSSKV